jgi:hypothetical protein
MTKHGQTMIYNTIHRKLKIEQLKRQEKKPQKNPKKPGQLRCSRRVSSSCSTSDIRRVTFKQHEYLW